SVPSFQQSPAWALETGNWRLRLSIQRSTLMRQVARAVLLIGGGAVLAVLVRRVGADALIEMLRRVGWTFLSVCLVYAVHVAVRATALWRTLTANRVRDRAILRPLWSGKA